MSQFRRAFEKHDDGSENDGKDNFIVMKGPLSSLYTEALMKEYAKDKTPEGIAVESQANDALTGLATAYASQGEDLTDDTGGATTVYGVSSSEVSEDDVVNISKELTGPDKVVLIIDGVKPGPNSADDTVPVERAEYLSDAMECFVKANGGEVFASLEEFAAWRISR